MKIDMNKKYMTRSGLDVRLLCTDAMSCRPVVGLIKFKCDPEFIGDKCSDGELMHNWFSNGKEGTEFDNDIDLIEVKEKKVMWLNIYKTEMPYDEIFPYTYPTKNA